MIEDRESNLAFGRKTKVDEANWGSERSFFMVAGLHYFATTKF